MNAELILNIVCYIGTGFTLLSYCFRTLKLRIFLICGNLVNIIWAIFAKQTPILVSNVLYIGINIYGLIKEVKVNETKKKFRALNPVFENGEYKCLDCSAKTEKELISILKKEGKL